MAKIIIGQEYKNEFKSICALYESGFISDEVNIIKAHGNVISTPTHTFEYCDDEHGVNGSGEGEDRSLVFTNRGSSWFAPLRGVEFDSGNADWKQLIMDVAADYHRHYSLIEFRQTKDKSALVTEKKLLQKFKQGFIDRVFADGKSFTLLETRQNEPGNFYAVSMRLEINGGGESAPLLGKIYFKEDASSKLVPVKATEAERIDKFVKEAVPSEEVKDTDEETVEVTLVGRVFNGLERAFSGGEFASYVIFNDRYEAEIRQMLSQLATSEIKELECTNVKVLGVSHVEWERSVYMIAYRGKPVLKLVIGLNGFVSVYCVNCGGEEPLIDDNVIIFKNGRTPDSCNAVIDFSMENLGLINSDIEAVKSNGVIADHLFTVSCRENPRNRDCFRIVCLHQTLDIGGGERKCRGCRYPEIIYKDIFSERGDEGRYTAGLNFAMDKLALVEEPTAKCKCCGREYTLSDLGKRGICSFCSDSDHSQNARNLYRKYGNMLGLRVRFFNLFAKKYCREQGNIILFEIGNHRYVFDKLDINEFGFIKKPKRVRRGGGR